MSDKTYELSCDCGALQMTARGAPELSLYCHCGSCRDLYNEDVMSGTGWADHAVDLPDESSMYEYSIPDKQMRRFGCPTCGAVMYGLHSPGIPVILHGRFRAANGGELPAELAPTLHLFYGERVLDIDDDLPKSEAGEMLGM